MPRKLTPAHIREQQINALPNIYFVRWHGEYKNAHSKVVCRCLLDGYEWATSITHLVYHNAGCPQCAGNRPRAAMEWASQIHKLPTISFVRWDGEYKNVHSKVIVKCAIDGYEWRTSAHHLVHKATGCPSCSESGYKPASPGTLYALRSRCGTMVKIGISNDYQRRHYELTLRTPFDWECIELIHSEDGSLIAEWEKELHSRTAPVGFNTTFDGHTEWRKWNDRLPQWFKRYRKSRHIAAAVAP